MMGRSPTPDDQDSASTIRGDSVTLRPLNEADLPVLLEILHQPEVARRWGSYDMDRLERELTELGEAAFAVEYDGAVIGLVQYGEETEPDYRHASIDVFIGSQWHGRGLGTDAVRTLARYLIEGRGHHRLTIDPAADNVAAISSYRKVGFRPVGIMREYERGADGKWHDGLLMDLLAEEFEEGHRRP